MWSPESSSLWATTTLDSSFSRTKRRPFPPKSLSLPIRVLVRFGCRPLTDLRIALAELPPASVTSDTTVPAPLPGRSSDAK